MADADEEMADADEEMADADEEMADADENQREERGALCSLEVGKLTELVNVTLGEELKHLEPEHESLAAGKYLQEVSCTQLEGVEDGDQSAVWEEVGGYVTFFM